MSVMRNDTAKCWIQLMGMSGPVVKNPDRAANAKWTRCDAVALGSQPPSALQHIIQVIRAVE